MTTRRWTRWTAVALAARGRPRRGPSRPRGGGARDDPALAGVDPPRDRRRRLGEADGEHRRPEPGGAGGRARADDSAAERPHRARDRRGPGGRRPAEGHRAPGRGGLGRRRGRRGLSAAGLRPDLGAADPARRTRDRVRTGPPGGRRRPLQAERAPGALALALRRRGRDRRDPRRGGRDLRRAARPGPVRPGRRHAAARHHPPRPPGYRQDAARESRRGGGRGTVLQRLRLRVRGGVRRPRLQARPRALRRGAQGGAVGRLHRRDRRSREPAHGACLVRRAGADPRPAADRDGRLRDPRHAAGGRAGVDEPHPGPRPGPGALGALRSQDRRGAAGQGGAPGDPRRPPARPSAVAGHRLPDHRRLHGRHGRRRSGGTLQRGLLRGGPGRAPTRSPSRTSGGR